MPEENPLVARARAQTTGVTGIGMLESANDLASGVKDGSWVEGGLGAVGVGLEALSLVTDPIGTLAQYGVSWLIEHVKPLTDCLDWLAGNPPVIQSFADTWANVATEVNAIAGDLGNESKNGTSAWTGIAGDAYRGEVAEQTDALAGAASLCDGISTGVMVMGQVVAAVRETVRDLIATLVGKLISWALEEACTLGFATPAVAVQATTAITNTISKVTQVIRKLIKTISNVGPKIKKIVEKLGEIIGKLSKLAKRMGKGAEHTSPSSAVGKVERDAHLPSQHTTPSGVHSPDGPEVPGSPPRTAVPGGSTADATTTSGARPGNPKDTKTPRDARRCENDPVDVATGEMVLSQIDLGLPAALPLVLRRVHVSSYRAGRHFGVSWASTLDQRLEFDEQGVLFAAEDGMLLVYPSLPGGGTAVMPEFGPRWPLARTKTGYQISQPEAGRTLHFPDAAPVAPINSITDRNGNRIDFDYGTDGMLAGVGHSGGYRISVDTEQGLITRLRLVGGGGNDIAVADYRYSENRHLTNVINSSGRPLKFQYDLAGRVTRWEDRNGQWYRYLYDGRGRCVANEGAGGFLNGTFAYDAEEPITRFTDSLGHTTTYLFDDARNLAAVTDPLGQVTTEEWDRFDRLLSRTDPLGRTTRYAYDDAGNLITVTRPDGTQALAEYNELALPTVQTDPDGAVWRLGYDNHGNLVSATDPAGATTTYSRDDRGNLVAKIDAVGNGTMIEVDAAGLPVAITTPQGATTRYTRDQFGRLTTMTDAMGGTARMAWTIEGKLLSRTGADGAVESWRYDGEGSEIEHVDTLGQVERTETTHFDLVSARTDRTGARTEFSYDTNLRLVAVTNPQGLRWRYEYDAAGRLVREQDFNGRSVSYGYDTAGYLAERTNGAGQTVRFVRDPLGRVVERRSAGLVSTFEFDEAGRLVRAVNPDSELSVRRDVRGRIIDETVDGRTISFRYDALGRVVGRRTPTGAESNWEYDSGSRPVSLRSGGRTVSFGYDPLGREVERLLDTGSVIAQAWDAGDRLLSQTVSTVTGESPTRQAHLVQQRKYHYRRDSHVSAIEDHLSGTRHFDLDGAGRIKGVRGAQWQERYAYDSAGNLVSAAGPGDAAAQGDREYSGTLLRRAGGVRYQHDAQGRVVLRQKKRLSHKPDKWRYTWDAEDRLIAVVTPDGAQWRYRYDPLGRRIAKQRLGPDAAVLEQTVFSWDGTRLAEQVHSSGRATTWDFDDGFRPLTQIERFSDRDVPQRWVDAQFFSIVTDMIGTPSELLDVEGKLAWRAQTTVWGEALGRLRQRADTPLRFPGQYHDFETGLNYNYFRYYDPENGRYESSDPLGLRPSVNPYGYVQNPCRSRDPLGLMGCDDPQKVLENLDPGDPTNQAARSRAWREIYVGNQQRRMARQAGNDLARGRSVPSELRGGRVDAPQASVPGSQYHVQGRGEGTPGLNLDGTFHDGDPGWSRKTYEWLYDHGWSWPAENSPPGEPPTHNPW